LLLLSYAKLATKSQPLENKNNEELQNASDREQAEIR
jgi:hypothetical protein